MSTQNTKLSVIIPVTDRLDPVKQLFSKYKDAIASTGVDYEFIYVVDGNQKNALQQLEELAKDEAITVISLAKSFGETTALNAAFSTASGEIYLTLPAYEQIEPAEIPKILEQLRDSDMVLARRSPRHDSILNRAQSATFNALLRLSTDLHISDAGCGVRAFKKEILDEVKLYGDLHRFFPVMAHRQGFKVTEVDTAQADADKKLRVYSPGIYLRRLLDILTIFFLVKFTKKPLRFFGMVGSSVFVIGLLANLYIILERIIWGVPLADRPALILSSLLIVLGIQIIAIGLIGEIIIFTHAKDIKEYKIKNIISYDKHQ